MVDAATLNAALQVGVVPDGELADLLSSLFPMSKWESGTQVAYFHPEAGHVFDLLYSKRSGRILRGVPGPGLTDELVAQVRELTVAASAPDTELEIRREILFSTPEIRGFWRHADDWQILPAPATAPRPQMLLGKHPFILEYKVRRSDSFQVETTRRFRRCWELHLLLSLLLRGQVIRESSAHPHHWILLREPLADGSHTVYANEGYMVRGFVVKAATFSDVSGIQKLEAVSDDEYYSRRGISVQDDGMRVPSCLDNFFDRFEAALPAVRDPLLRACYWLDSASRVWDTSKSMSFVAAINAIEALAPPRGERDPCPCCGTDRNPGPSAHFRSLVETHAAAESEGARAAMYEFRSRLVHGGVLHGLDIPDTWGALVPRTMQQHQWHDAAFAVARAAVRNWFLDLAAS
ncbi:hypothetical protein [Nonomuraea wenchangensis]|uniref:hypothetical protein n=1 Tax=Nonomuraea wenchangensis TaxID=568860 RepID=UPI00332CFA89